VTAEAPLVNTTSGSLGGLVDEQKMADLPLNGRNYIDLTLLQAGISETKGPSSANVAYTGTYFVSNGATVRSNNYMMDGASMVNLWGASSASTTGSTLGVDGIKEYKVITNSFSAEYGLTMGSQMVIVSKGGTNTFHGDVFEYLRNSALDARNFFDKSIPANGFRRLPEFQRNNFGAAFGGPIKKDKTFFYGVYEGVRERLGVTTIDNVMPAACHQPNNIVDNVACLGLSTPGTTPVAPVIQPILALFPSSNLAGNQYTYPYTQPSADNYGQMRVDQTISDKDTLFVRYTIQNTTRKQPTSYPQFASDAVSRNQFLTLSESRIVSPTVLNTFRTSFSRTNLNWVLDDAPGMNSPQLSLVQGLDMGTVSITGITSIGAAGTSPRLEKQNIFTWSDDLFYTRGRHALKFGTLINHYQQQIVNSQSYTGVANFAKIGSGTAMSAFVAGAADTIRALTVGSALKRNYHFNTVGFYLQDDWRVLPRLTLNLGLRYEFNTSPVEANGQFAVFKNLATDALPTVSATGFQNPSLKNFSPRLGFAWDVTGNGKTALRGGFDYLYDLVDLQTGANLLQTQIATPPFSNRLQGNKVNLAADVSAGGGLPLQFPPTTASLAYRPTDWNIKQPAMLVYNLAVERQLPFEMSLTVAYAGSQGRHLMAEREGNPTIPQGVPSGGACIQNTGAINTASMLDNGTATACFLATDSSALDAQNKLLFRTNKNFGSTDYFIAANNSSYNALQVGLIKRISKGLQLQSSYTWSKSIDETSGIRTSDSDTLFWQSGYCQRCERGRSAFDNRHRLVASGLYDLPIGKGKKVNLRNRFVNTVVGGWQLGSIVTWRSGFPINPTAGVNRANTNIANDRPDATGQSISLDQPTTNQWFNTAAFTLEPIYTFGNAGRNTVPGPAGFSFDFSTHKDFRIKEGHELQFRWEAFNVLNHPVWGLPNTSLSSSNFGRITSTNGSMRQMQFALKYVF